jgi:hypothetical protein
MDCRKKAGKTSQLSCFKLAGMAGLPRQALPGLKTRQNCRFAGFDQPVTARLKLA